MRWGRFCFAFFPMGPAIESAGQAADPIGLRISPWAHRDFNLYEGEGDCCRNEHRAHGIIPIQLDDASRKVTIGERKESYSTTPLDTHSTS